MNYNELRLNQTLRLNGTRYHVDSHLPWYNLLRPYIFSISLAWQDCNLNEYPEVFYVVHKSGQLHIPAIERAGRVLLTPIDAPLDGDIDILIPSAYVLTDFKVVL